MKILDRYILTSYLKTFISVFVILMLIFVLQAIWLYIKELAGKELDPITIAKFLFYITPTLVPLILPLTILLASIMVFGNFAENYEFAAMKSTGISLQRAMSGLSIFIVLLAITTFYFSNNVIPWAQYESYNLRKNIAKVKPQQFIAEGQFNQIGETFNIKVEKKYGDRDHLLESVIIHQGQLKKPGNHKTIIAKNGELVGAENSEVLKLILFDGYYYNDTPPKKNADKKKKPFTKSTFKEYTMNIDLSQLNTVNLDDKSIDSKYTMLSVSELDYYTDSLITKRTNNYKNFGKTLYGRTNITNLNLTLNPKKDTIYSGNIIDLFDTKKQVQLLDYSINAISSTKQIITSKEANMKGSTILLNKHIISLHEKFALAIACIILFFVGAPLGALIRKGGLGLPMVIAIILFLSYHFIGIFAKNSAKDGSFNPALATWFSTLIMLPLSIFLTRRATADRGIFEFDHITIPIKNWYNKRFGNNTIIETTKNLKSIEQKTIAKELSLEDESLLKEKNTLLKITLTSVLLAIVLFILHFVFANNKAPLMANVVMQLSPILLIVGIFFYFKSKEIKLSVSENYNNQIVNSTITSITEDNIDATTNNVNEKRTLTIAALVCLVSAIILLIMHFVFANNKLPLLANVVIQLSPILCIVSLFFFIKRKTRI